MDLNNFAMGFVFAICLNSYQAQHLVFVFPDIRQIKIKNSRIGKNRKYKNIRKQQEEERKNNNQSNNM
jgi:hypothetical protein